MEAELRPENADDQDPAEGDERRIVSVCAELLPAVSAGGAHGAADRHIHVPPRLPLYRAGHLNRTVIVAITLLGIGILAITA